MDKKAYIEECRGRWHSKQLRDCSANWGIFKKHHAELVELLRPYLRDNFLTDLNGRCMNPAGSLTAWLWLNSESHTWLWDFCEHYQQCHLRRGLIAYCKQVIEEIRDTANPDNTVPLPLCFPSSNLPSAAASGASSAP